MDKKILVIIGLSIIIGILIFINISGSNTTQATIDTLSGQLDKSIKSNLITERELDLSLSAVGRLQDIIDDTDKQLKQVLNDIAEGNEKTESDLSEYGDINQDFADFIRQNEPVEQGP